MGLFSMTKFLLGKNEQVDFHLVIMTILHCINVNEIQILIFSEVGMSGIAFCHETLSGLWTLVNWTQCFLA